MKFFIQKYYLSICLVNDFNLIIMKNIKVGEKVIIDEVYEFVSYFVLLVCCC